MRKVAGFLFLNFWLCWMVSCKKNNESAVDLTGTWAGVFEHIYDTLGPKSVTLTFSADSFRGESEMSGYPYICHGNYQVEKDSILFHNLCFSPTFPAWKYELDGKYKMIVQGDSLWIHRLIGDFVYEEEVYSLRKQ